MDIVFNRRSVRVSIVFKWKSMQSENKRTKWVGGEKKKIKKNL